MSVWGALVGGLVGTVVLTTTLRAASEFRLTRIDLPFLLGTAFSDDRRRAKAIGYALHLLAGLIFALIYWVAFRVLGESSWWLGGLFGLVHVAFAGSALVNVLLPVVHPRMGTPATSARSTPLLEPPGFMLMNYGRRTPIVAVVAHVAYGMIVGAFVSAAG
ncbi:MAG TPA: hypothetical protein VGU26_06740 [Gaiellaceae bacterium]|nr:hypothetical protein [Gaiellaceae bacterium]